VCELIKLLGYFIHDHGRLSMAFYKSQNHVLYQMSNDLDNEVITINRFRTFPTPIDQFIHSKESSFFFFLIMKMYIESLLNKK